MASADQYSAIANGAKRCQAAVAPIGNAMSIVGARVSALISGTSTGADRQLAALLSAAAAAVQRATGELAVAAVRADRAAEIARHEEEQRRRQQATGRR